MLHPQTIQLAHVFLAEVLEEVPPHQLVAQCDEDAFLEVLTDRAVAMAEAVAEPYGFLLRQVADCEPAEDGPLRDQQRCGASFKSLAAIGHRVGMTKVERVQWYRIAEVIPLSQCHAGHILSRLKRRAA